MSSANSRRSLLNYIGIAVLLVGLGVGDFKYWRALQAEPDDEEDPLVSAENSRTYEREVERINGKFGLLLTQWTESLAALGNPRPFAVTIMVVSTLLAGGCFLTASRMPRN